MKEIFVVKNFSPASEELLAKVNQILAQYDQAGYTLSVRQLYYQLVSRDYIPNNMKSYKRIVGLVGDARMAGMVDWRMIEDRNRETTNVSMWDNPGQILRAAANGFRTDPWINQAVHIEVMCEKDALSGILEPVCNRYRVNFTANKGYASLSLMYEMGKRIMRQARNGKEIHLFYFGDHDPSGIDMTRDITDRLSLFSGVPFEIDRLALNWDQVQMWNPPENPAKSTDSRYMGYVTEFGESSWELDAVEPAELADLVEQSVVSLLDRNEWDKTMLEDEIQRDRLIEIADNWEE